MRQKGSMTIAMCMMLSVMLGIVAAGIKLCREQYARVQAVNAADTGLYSVFSEYERIFWRITIYSSWTAVTAEAPLMLTMWYSRWKTPWL
ncbi:hypothetical protein LC724_17265 [Blautia sp. RD014234]|nr:hypothetical protein [Blautia parvula]